MGSGDSPRKRAEGQIHRYTRIVALFMLTEILASLGVGIFHNLLPNLVEVVELLASCSKEEVRFNDDIGRSFNTFTSSRRCRNSPHSSWLIGLEASFGSLLVEPSPLTAKI